MKQIYAPIIMLLLLIPFIGNANYTKHIETAPPCTADIITTDQEICDNFFMISAVAPEAGETGTWGGPTGTSFVAVNDPTTFVTNLNAGNNVITWTISDASGDCSVDQITLINSQVISTPSISTPNNEEWCDENGFEVTAQGPLLPGETGFWSGGGGQTFSNPNGLTTTVNNMQPGNNVIFWNITNGTCDANPASITVVNNEVTTVAEIEVFSAPESCVTDGFAGIFANLTNQLVPGETGTWTGPPGVTFTPNSEAPTIDNLLPGDNVLTWTITRGSCPPSSTTFTVTNNEPNNVNININDSDNAACFGDPLNLSADAPLAGQTGMWSGPAGSVFSPNASSPAVTVTDAPVGTHDFTWTLTQGGCSLSDAIQVVIHPQPVGTYTVNPTTTVGGSDGSVDICVASGASPFTITWDPPQGTVMPTNDPACTGESFNVGGLTAGMYVVTITDLNGCFDVLGDGSGGPGDTITVLDPDCSDFDFGLITSTNESCDESDDGTITIEVLNAEGDILYSVGNVNGVADVTTAQNPYTFENLPEGDYNLFISDARLCTDSYIGNPVVITAPVPLGVTATGVPITTVNGTDGMINVCPTGGTGPFTVTWNPTSSGSVAADPNNPDCQIISGLPEGDYSVMVVDANGCSFNVDEVTVNPPICMITLDATNITTTNVSCNGANDGTITVGGTTDTPPLEYSVDGGMTYSSNSLFENLAPGTYQILIKDNQGCIAGPVEITITEPDLLAATPNIIAVSTVDGSDGQIQLCIEGGTPPNTVTWSPANVGSVGPNTDPNCPGESVAISGLSKGMYIVSITDANGCLEVLGDMSGGPGDTLVVPEPNCIYTTEVNFMNNSCGVSPTNPSYDGTLEVTIVGGAPGPYTIDIGCGVAPVTGVTSETYTFTGLEPCNYIVSVTSSDGCIFGYSGNPVQITAPDLLSAPFTLTETTTVSGNDGEICLEPMGGTPPYTVTICGQTATQGGACNGYFLGGLMTGDTCNVLVLDDNDCESTGVLFISGPDCSSFSAELDGQNGVMGSCAESPTGAINLNVSGGMEPYTYIWSNGATTEDLMDIPGGTYYVTVSDVQECEVIIDSITVETYDPVDFTVGVSVNGMFSGTNEYEITTDPITLGVDANFPIDMILWSPPDGLDDPTSETPVALPDETTTYTVTITTAEGCMASDTIRVIANPGNITPPTGFTPNGDGTNDHFYPVINGNAEVLALTVWNRWGEKVYDNPNPPGWDGSYKSVKQPLSSFVFVLEYKLPGKNPEVLKGDFVLIR